MRKEDISIGQGIMSQIEQSKHSFQYKSISEEQLKFKIQQEHDMFFGTDNKIIIVKEHYLDNLKTEMHFRDMMDYVNIKL